jgi:hypothetical protein
MLSLLGVLAYAIGKMDGVGGQRHTSYVVLMDFD